jgi:predicted RNA polymerase sigma factor
VATTPDPTPTPATEADVGEVWRREAPHVLAALARRWRDFGACEDAAQEALAAATIQWPRDGRPDRPRAWLIRVASRRLIDQARQDTARRDREDATVAAVPSDRRLAPPADAVDAAGGPAGGDDTLALLVLCCHPALTPAGQVALTLRAVAGLTTAQIAAAFNVPAATMAQRISRAKSTLREAGAEFGVLDAATLGARLGPVRHVLYLVFNEGYATSGGEALVDVELTTEAVRLARQLRTLVPDDAEQAGLVALMLLTHARTAARTDDHGDLVPLEHQDRDRWDRDLIAEGVALLEAVLPVGEVGPFQLQAAIAATHAEAASWAETDWLQIAALYEMLDRRAPSPFVTLNRAVAVGMSAGPEAGLRLVDTLLADDAMVRHHRTHAVRAHLLEMAGRRDDAVASYRRAARLTRSAPEQRYLHGRATACARE